jgi:hypothetical protein
MPRDDWPFLGGKKRAAATLGAAAATRRAHGTGRGWRHIGGSSLGPLARRTSGESGARRAAARGSPASIRLVRRVAASARGTGTPEWRTSSTSGARRAGAQGTESTPAFRAQPLQDLHVTGTRGLVAPVDFGRGVHRCGRLEASHRGPGGVAGTPEHSAVEILQMCGDAHQSVDAQVFQRGTSQPAPGFLDGTRTPLAGWRCGQAGRLPKPDKQPRTAEGRLAAGGHGGWGERTAVSGPPQQCLSLRLERSKQQELTGRTQKASVRCGDPQVGWVSVRGGARAAVAQCPASPPPAACPTRGPAATPSTSASSCRRGRAGSSWS